MKKSYVQVRMPNGSYRLVEKSARPPRVDAPLFMPDIKTAVSPIDGTVLSSRSVRDEHNRRHGVVDVGGEPLNRSVQPPGSPGGVRHDIVESIRKLEQNRERYAQAPERISGETRYYD